jgi:hypothetical protein
MTALSIRNMNFTLSRREQSGGHALSPEREKQIKIDVTLEQRDTFLRNARWAKKHGLTKDVQIYVRMACRFHKRLRELKAQS